MTVLILASPLNVLLNAVSALTHPIHHFITAPHEPRTHYEPGAEALAMLAGPELKGAIAHIENRQAQPFRQPVTIYVTATPKSFQTLTSAKGDPRAVGFKQKRFLSPKLAERPKNSATQLNQQ